MVDEGKIAAEAALTFTQYCLSLKTEDYAMAFSLEPRFIQKTAGSVEVYKEWWLSSAEYNEWRQLYAELKIKTVEILTLKRVAILVDSPDERMTRVAFYVFPEDGKWKVGCFEHVLKHTKGELEKLKDSIKQFYEKNGRLPESLSELTPEYIAILPVDLFNDKEESYCYVKEENGNFIIYSFGPDSDDDLGKVEYNYENGLLSDGDIIIKIF